MNKGFITLHRNILDHFGKDKIALNVFIHLLLKAHYKDSTINGIKIKRGQLITGRKALSEQLMINENTVRDALKRLISTPTIHQQSTNKYSIITICNYDKYQLSDKSHQPTKHQQNTTYKRIKNKEYTNSNYYVSLGEKILDYLNNTLNKKFKKTAGSLKHINARLQEGYNEDDFKKVIDLKKKDKWFNENPKYYRPQTLFNSEKFPSYLEETKLKSKNDRSKAYEGL